MWNTPGNVSLANVKQHGNSLVIKRISRRNEGRYECFAYDDEETSRSMIRGGVHQLMKKEMFRARSFLKVVSKW